MRPGYGMYQQQSAKMYMTPKLRQAIKILQLATPDLLDYVRQELEENPVLESAGTEWAGCGKGSREYDPLRHAASHELTLEKHLKEQLSFVKNIPRAVRRIVLYIIGNLDSNGYLEPSLDEIAQALDESLKNVAQALQLVQSFEPTGVGARNLRECLLLQAKRLPSCSPLVLTLISEHLEDLANYRIHKSAAALDACKEDIERAIAVIKELNPKPGSAFAAGDNQYIIPDVTIERAGELLTVSVHDAAAPRLSVSSHYERMAKDFGEHQQVHEFLRQKLRSARFLVKCIEQRRWTLLRVTQAIVEEQEEFFRNGRSCLKPLNLRQIADRVGLHESTVSRATAGKYALTPWGVFELSDFFPSGLQTDFGEPKSAESVKERIKDRIRTENKQKPYSDQKLAELLMEEGIRISRRTVTKYREELGIAASVRRRRL